jgi:cytoskeletal protein CcmA (bactofilin family)
MAKSIKKNDKPHFANIPNHLNSGAVIEGNIKLEGHLRLDGKILGNLTCSGKVVVGETGEVVGNIYCESADVMGMVKGDIRVKANTSLFVKSKVIGNIYTLTINIEPGAVFNGKCMMGTDEK